MAVASLTIAAGCAGGGHHDLSRARQSSPGKLFPSPRVAARRLASVIKPPPLEALVTAQTEDRLLVMNLQSGRILRRIQIPGNPGYVATMGSGGPVAVVSSASGTVTMLGGRSLHVINVLRAFGAPHIPAMSPDGGYAYVTDDSRGQVAAIRLFDAKVVSRTFAGAGAHHLAFSPNLQQVWVALGESASTIGVLSTVVSRPAAPASVRVSPGHPRLVGRFRPGYLAHDLLFAPNGRQVWITAANRADVGAFSARTHRLLFRVRAGPPPQHVAFDGRYAYLTSGYGSRIEQVSVTTGRVLKRVAAPYGSFELDAGGGYVVTSSLLRGTLAIYDRQLRLLRVRHVGPSAEDVAIYRP
jgi:DNA-binding beta-propeller fold protein YncE